MTSGRLADSFLKSPLFSDDYSRGFGTLYTARYEPQTGRVRVLWPDRVWERSFAAFDEEDLVVEYGALSPS